MAKAQKPKATGEIECPYCKKAVTVSFWRRTLEKAIPAVHEESVTASPADGRLDLDVEHPADGDAEKA